MVAFIRELLTVSFQFLAACVRRRGSNSEELKPSVRINALAGQSSDQTLAARGQNTRPYIERTAAAVIRSDDKRSAFLRASLRPQQHHNQLLVVLAATHSVDNGAHEDAAAPTSTPDAPNDSV